MIIDLDDLSSDRQGELPLIILKKFWLERMGDEGISRRRDVSPTVCPIITIFNNEIKP